MPRIITKRFLIWGTLLLMFCSSGMAQRPNFANDTLAFRQYLSYDNIGRSVDVQLLLCLYKRFKDPKTKDLPVEKWFDSNDPQYTFDVGYFTMSHLFGNWHIDNALLPDSLRHRLLTQVRYYHWMHPNRRADKALLVERITGFRDKATSRPPFLKVIDSLYGGNVKKYVDALYGKSFLGGGVRMALFTRKPTLQKLINDPGVQFALDLTIYELWIKNLRERQHVEVPPAQ